VKERRSCQKELCHSFLEFAQVIFHLQPSGCPCGTWLNIFQWQPGHFRLIRAYFLVVFLTASTSRLWWKHAPGRISRIMVWASRVSICYVQGVPAPMECPITIGFFSSALDQGRLLRVVFEENRGLIYRKAHVLARPV